MSSSYFLSHYVFFTGVVTLAPFFCRDTGNGSLLGRLCCEDDVDATECSERTLSRLDVRLNVDVSGVVAAIGIGICDGFNSESPIELITISMNMTSEI